MSIQDWAARWGIPQQALDELPRFITHHAELDENNSGKTEAYSQSQVRLEAPHKGVLLYRNNNGAGKIADDDGVSSRFMRWGLANDSAKLNKVFKSADLIGLRKRLITADMVGKIIGQFYSRECKRPGWTYSGTPEEVAQLNWANVINANGGDAKFVTGPGSFEYLTP